MIKVYLTTKTTSSEDFAREILTDHYHISFKEFSQTKYGKPYIKCCPIKFNLSHSDKYTVLAVSSSEVGIDCELIKDKKHESILNRFSPEELSETTTPSAFFENWTAKESYIKLLGKSLAKELKNIKYIGGKIIYKNKPVKKYNVVTLTIDKLIISVCSKDLDINLIKVEK